MTSINLLPWRDSKRIRKNKQFIQVLLISGLIGVAMIASVWGYLNNLKNSQQQVNDQISALNLELDKSVNQIDALEKRRESMLAGMQIIEDLQAKRAIPVKAWNEIAKALPKQAYLTFMKREADLISFRGKTQNPDKVSTFVRNLEAMPLFEKAQVKLIKQSEKSLSPTLPPTQQLASELYETNNQTIDQTIDQTSNHKNETINQINEVEFLVTVHLTTLQQVNNLTPSIDSNRASSQPHLTQNTTSNQTPSANSHDSTGAN